MSKTEMELFLAFKKKWNFFQLEILSKTQEFNMNFGKRDFLRNSSILLKT